MSAPVVAFPNNNNNHDRPHNPIPVFENSPTFQMACRQLESVAEVVEIDKGILEPP